MATQYLDAVYGNRWHGYRINSTMALDWPRYSVEERDGYLLASNAVPDAIEDATAILALRVVAGDTLLPDVSAAGNVTAESVTVGPISVSNTFTGEKTAGKRYAMVELLLSGLMSQSGAVWRA